MRLVWSLGLEWLQREGNEGKQPLLLSFFFFFFLYFGRRFLLSFFFFPPFLFPPPSSCGNEVACPPSSLACHPDTPPSLAHAQASYQLVSSVAAAGADRTAGTTQSLLSSLHSLFSQTTDVLVSQGTCVVFCWPLAASATK